MLHPARTYELSIYRATPVSFWVAVSLAFLAGVAANVNPHSGRWDRRGGFLLAYLSSMAVVSLDVLRGYRYYGAADSLTHLGWVKDFAAGLLEPTGLLYPGVHTLMLFLGDVGGVPFTHSGQLVVVAFAAVYLLFVPLCAYYVTTHPLAYPVGLLSALLWLPINDISVHRMVHPVSLGALFFPVVLFLAFAYVNTESDGPSATGALLTVAAMASLLIHPQLGITVVVILGTMAAAQYLLRRLGVAHPIAYHRSTHVQAAAATLFVLLWTPRFERVRIMFREVSQGLAGGPPTGDEISTRGRSLAVLGGSIEELFAKLFAVTLVFLAVFCVFVAVTWIRRKRSLFRGRTVHAQYAVLGTVPLVCGFFLLFASSVSTQHFRVLGYIMVLVTLVGAIALVAFARRVSNAGSLSHGRTAVVVFLLLMLPLSTMTLFFSPFIYQPTPHVTSAHMEGYDTAFDHRMDGVTYTGIRDGPRRYLDALRGTVRSTRLPYGGEGRGVPGEVFETNLTSYFDEQRYLIVTRSDYEREVVLYEGFRYSKEGFRSLDTDPRIYRVQSNGVVREYLLTDSGGATGESEATATA